MTNPDTSDQLPTVASILSVSDPDEFAQAVENLRKIDAATLRSTFSSLLIDPDSPVALGITRAIGILNLPDAIDLLIGLAEEPGKWFSHEDRKAIQSAAVESLGMLRDPRALDVLMDILKNSHNPDLELESVKAIALIAHPDSVCPLLESMNANPPLALSAAGALVQIGGDEALYGLMSALRHDSEMVRSASVWALGEMRDERAIDSLIRIGSKSDTLSRLDVVWAMGRIGGLTAFIALGEISKTDPDNIVRLEAGKALQSCTTSGKSSDSHETDEAQQVE